MSAFYNVYNYSDKEKYVYDLRRLHSNLQIQYDLLSYTYYSTVNRIKDHLWLTFSGDCGGSC